MKKLILLAAAFALAVANAATYKLDLLETSYLKGTTLKAGTYKLEVNDNTAVISSGKIKVEAKVTVKTVERKFHDTSITFIEQNGQRVVSEISIGGTTTKLIFDTQAPILITR